MPSLVTHHLFAEQALALASAPLQYAIEADAPAYYWGAQGPDVLFFHNAPFGSRTALLGQKMHEECVAESFNAMIRSAVRQESDTALAYLLGFCTHYVLDRRAHPYIQDTITTLLRPLYPQYDEDACHRLCEANLDAAVIMHYWITAQESFEAFRLLDMPAASAIRTIGRILTDIGEPVYHIETTPQRVEAAMRSMRLVYIILHGGESAKPQLEALETMLGKPGLLSPMLRPRAPLEIDCANRSRRTWHKPYVPEISRQETFFELMEDAVSSASALQQAMLNAFQQDAPLNPLFFPMDYNGKPLTAPMM